ncbi:MAG: hypothetical protein GY856_31330 [bacterium]|nr:hypothetical protein [bacterium]
MLLEAAAALCSRAGKAEDTAYALVEMGKTFLLTGELVEILRIQQRLLAILHEVADTYLTSNTYLSFLSKATRWAKELGIPVANRREMETLLLTRRRVRESCQPPAELTVAELVRRFRKVQENDAGASQPEAAMDPAASSASSGGAKR